VVPPPPYHHHTPYSMMKEAEREHLFNGCISIVGKSETKAAKNMTTFLFLKFKLKL
jgi:hypothetical protein